jgi:chromosome segregation ATPase
VSVQRQFRLVSGAFLAAGLLAAAWAQSPGAGSIFTCVDARGQRLTSDRPIVECLDREQRELKRDGTVRRTIGPALTAQERAAYEERERKLAEERQRQVDEKRAQKALLHRYPNQAAHDAERMKALRAAQEVIAAGQVRVGELQEQRRQLQQETEFYKDAAKWPVRLRRAIEETEQQIAAQQRFVEAQEDEKERIEARFDEELARLRVLWAQLAAASTATSGAASGVNPAPASQRR